MVAHKGFLTPILWNVLLLYHIFPGLMFKVLTQTHFLLEPGCEDYSLLDQAIADFEHALDSTLTDCQNTRVGCIL